MSGSKQHTDTSSLPAPVQVSQKSLTGLLEISPDALVVVDQTGTILMVNEQTEALFGYGRGELSGQLLNTLIPERFQKRHAGHFERYFSAPRTRLMSADLQLSGRRKDGSEFPVDISLRPVQVGQSLYAVGAVRDVTERKRMEEVHHQLLQRERQAKEAEYEMARMRSLFSQAPALIHILRGPDHVFEFFHPLGKELVGERDLTGMKVREALPEYEGQGYFELLDHIYQTGESYRNTEMPSLLKAADGTLIERFFSTIFQPWYDVDGQMAGIMNFAVEVTEQVRTRQQLEESEKRFRALADAMPQMVWTAGSDGVLDYCNQRWLEYTGMAEYNPVQGFRPVMHPDDLSHTLERWHHALESGQVFEVECRYRRGRDGSYRWHLARALPVRNGNGAIVKWYGTTTDIDDQKRIEEALRRSEARLRDQANELEQTNRELRHHRDELIQANADLEKANRGRQFFSTMSHELRTPLASIIGFSQLLLANAEEVHWTQQQKSNLERILKNGQHLLSLINDVLDLVKIEAGRMEISFTQVDVREIITWVVEETYSLAIEKKLEVSTAIEDEVPSIESNPVKLRQVLLNLVSNALKYTERGGVTISAARVGGDQLALAVQDSGIGISEEMQERIFEAFYQVDGGYTRKTGGTGLGLAIVSQLTGLLGGKIELKSAPGQGSTFTVILPVKSVTKRGKQDTLNARTGWEDGTSLPLDSAASLPSKADGKLEPEANALAY